MPFGNLLSLKKQWQFGYVLLLNICWRFGNTQLLSVRWQFCDNLSLNIPWQFLQPLIAETETKQFLAFIRLEGVNYVSHMFLFFLVATFIF
jgi:hypothetical protein